MEPTSNVQPLFQTAHGPEATLRDALSTIALERANGNDAIGVVVMIVKPGFLPDLTFSGMDQQTIAAAALRLQHAALEELDRAIFEYGEGGEGANS